MADRARIQKLAEKHLAAGDPLGWFEPVYQSAGRRAGEIPWADMSPHPRLVEWLDRSDRFARSIGQPKALVVGCGLGDDAELLVERGFNVVAFDIAPTAVAWCRERRPDSAVDYCVGDLLAPDQGWLGAFDLVVEIYTLQTLPDNLRFSAIDAISRCVKPGGRALVICRGRQSDENVAGPPWPVTRNELDRFLANGLRLDSFIEYIDDETPPVTRWVAAYLGP